MMKQKNNFWVDALHIFVLCGFAVAQPLYDLLSRNAEFFIAQQSEPIEVVALLIFLSLILPALLVLLETIAGLISRNLRKIMHIIWVACLVTFIAMAPLKHIPYLPGIAVILCSTLLGLVFAVCYSRFYSMRSFLNFLSVSLLLFPALFLFHSPVYKIVFPKNKAGMNLPKVKAKTPVIMVVLDELSLISLLDNQYQIDPIRYPNFSALAKNSTWFRNATATADNTTQAVPAILTGSYPKQGLLPNSDDYPQSLFTLLGGSYKMKVIEPEMLCPKILCPEESSSQNFIQDMRSMLSDISLVYLHIILPSNFSDALPPITQNWTDFWGKEQKSNIPPSALNALLAHGGKHFKDRAEIFQTFAQSIQASDKATLYYLHILLPHVPWEYLPLGKLYTQRPILGLGDEIWLDNDLLVIEGYQRHLLQTEFVDKLIGELLSRLKETGLYDRSLIIVTADHGVSFWPNESRRPATSKTHVMDILQVPLFIKVPNQRDGKISDRNVESIDILPTIADLLGISLPWPLDGQSAFNLSLPERPQKKIFQKTNKQRLFDAAFNPERASLDRKLALFGSEEKSGALFRRGPYHELISHPVDEFQTAMPSNIEIKIDGEKDYKQVDLNGHFIPAYMMGTIQPNQMKKNSLNLAIAMNGTIRAISKTYNTEKGETKFSALVPQASFQAGKNNVDVYVITETEPGQIRLLPTKMNYWLVKSPDQTQEFIVPSNGTSIPIISNAISGRVDQSSMGKGFSFFAGWAADIRNFRLPQEILIFADEKFFCSGFIRVKRPDVATVFHNNKLEKSGFHVTCPKWLFEVNEKSFIRVFAVSEGKASELGYHEGYPWKPSSEKFQNDTFELLENMINNLWQN